MHDFEVTGNITTVTSGIIIHGCNAQGKMNSGVAKAIRTKWPEAYRTYMHVYEIMGPLKLGSIIPVRVDDDLIVINAITQEYYGYDNNKYISYKALSECLNETNQFMLGMSEMKQTIHLHYPKIGAGLAGGSWPVIDEIITNSIDGSIPRTLWVL